MSTTMPGMQTGGASGVGTPTAAPPGETSGPPPSEGGQPRDGEARDGQRRASFDFFRRLLRPQSAPPEADPPVQSPNGATSAGGPTGGPADVRPAGDGSAPVAGRGQPGRQRQERPGAAGAPADPERLTLTRAELTEFVNAEVNRREAKQKAEQDRARRRQLRDADPIGYAEEEREREALEDAQAAQRERMGQSLAYYDQHTLAPFLNSLPPDIVEQLRTETGGGVEGLEGRGRLMARAQELLVERVRGEERARAQRALRQAPILRKQENLRQAEADVTPDPEAGGGFAPGATGVDPNTQLRTFLQASRTRTH